jgi:hypothetical protein
MKQELGLFARKEMHLELPGIPCCERDRTGLPILWTCELVGSKAAINKITTKD